MSVLDYVLAPFLFLIEQVFLVAYSITNNYGLSIVALSFIVSALLLPVFILIEKAKKKDDVVKRRMKPFIDEVKRCYSGQERHYYLKTINRQHHYNPVRSLIPTLSLLLQIPFFIAAYQFLEGFAPLSGVSFLFINDLNAPDGVFGSVNLLPIAMTVVNLVTAYFYTRNGNLAELKQMAVVAALFLVLLFNLPAGLVLYWTMNNVFSFFRLFITNPEAFHKNHARIAAGKLRINELKKRLALMAPKLRFTFTAILFVGAIVQLNEVLSNGTQNLLPKVLNVIAISIIVPLSVVILSLLHKKSYSVNSTGPKAHFYALWTKFRVLFFVLLAANVAIQINWALTFGFDSLAQRLVLSVIVSILGAAALAFVVLVFQGHVKLSKELRLGISVLVKKEKQYLFVGIALLLIAFAVKGIVLGVNDIVIQLFVAIVVWSLTFFVALNRKVIFSKEKFGKLVSALLGMFNSPVLVFSILFLVVYFMLASNFYYTGVNRELNIAGFVVAILGQLLGIYYYLKEKSRAGVLAFFKVGIIALAAVQLILTVLYVIKANFITFLTLDCLLMALTAIGGVFIVFTLPYFFKLSAYNFTAAKQSVNGVFVLSLLYFTTLVFFWNPLIVYSSFPETFSFPAIQIFSKNAFHFAGVFALILGLFLILPKKIKTILAALFAAISLVFFVNIFIAPVRVGSLQMGRYIEAENLAMPYTVFIAEAVLLLLCFTIVKRLIVSGSQLVKKVIIALFIIGVGQSLITSISRGDFFTKETASLDLPATISFSKTKKNVIYIIPDTFMGMYMKGIMEDIPEAVAEYEGFVWYPNTLSVSTLTTPSISSLLGGAKYNLDSLNEDAERTMAEKITDVTMEFTAKIKEQGYSMTSSKMAMSKIDKRNYDAYLPPWHPSWNKWNDELNIGGAKELDFAILWKNAFFYGSPLFLKPKIYRNGDWIKVEDETNKNSTLTQDHNFIRLLTHVSDTLGSQGNFVYIHTKATHGPWNIVKDNGDLVMNVTPYDCQKRFIELFSRWIVWMKENGVYDNTKIVMVSDHAHLLPDEWVEGFGDEYSWNEKGQEKLSVKDFWKVNALLMVKDFNAQGALKEDWRLMSNSDASDIAFGVYDTAAPVTRAVPVFYIDAIPRSATKKELPIKKQFIVKDNIYNPDNWTLVN